MQELQQLAALFAQGRPDLAGESARELLKSFPEHGLVWKALGMAAQQTGQPGEAVAALRKAVTFLPEDADSFYNLGLLFMGMKKPHEAEEAFRAVLRIDPGAADALNNLGVLLGERKALDEAAAALREAVRVDPGYAEAYNNLGLVLTKQKHHPEAEAAFREALRLRPAWRDAYTHLGVLLKEQKRYPEAEAAYREALRIDPAHADTHANLGLLLDKTLRDNEAEAALREAIRLAPDAPGAYVRLGNFWQRRQRMAEAEAILLEALRYHPGDAEAMFSLGLVYLMQGRYTEGWRCYEYRYHPERDEPITVPDGLQAPQWGREELNGLSLLVLREQGFGDEIQFCRFFPLLLARGARRVIYVCRQPLRAWFSTLPGVELVGSVAEAAGYDRWTFLMSLPGQLGITLANLPAGLPCLGTLPERDAFWRRRLPAGSFRVGLVWKGATGHANDANRSLPGLEVLAPLWGVAGVTFISLQKGAGEEEAASPPAGQPLYNAGAGIRDFADTASILKQLDLVIGVDTTVIHACGALGKACLVLLPAIGSDWRWLSERQESPWYPGVMRLVRQERPGEWSGAVAEAARELARRTA
ncbi:MAG: tetratricopeptide repeat protein [Magnetococcales bacterium]|nr:tetratricopeptide repeat protein [Magnetococcales bacterium]